MSDSVPHDRSDRDRELALVELVDLAGAATGTATVAVAHTAPGRLHRAFSVVIVDGDRRVLLQRRAASKTRFAGLWANACCGHPPPGSDLVAAASDRLREELGLDGVPLERVGTVVYRAADADSGLVEHEYDHVLVGRVTEPPTVRPDPDEVQDWAWLDAQQIVGTSGAQQAPWLQPVLHAAKVAWAAGTDGS